ncbi:MULTISPECIES: hypothetical protein [Virgibacillus]|uniref:hypothetical protein n=1 Tax=Virgibacillus TaxID=84406 RepID=UPI00038848A0|nr:MULTISPECIES: hypothetical protein [Virgibacillus]EQB37881.1 hypothetical protein M948_04765 [Virgibacillus sp. CM-4]MYL40607.1 hypothetical protein [Virgibacillus massiliensis]
MYFVKFIFVWIVGIIVTTYIINLFQGEAMDWGNVLLLVIGGLIGLVIGKSIKNTIKKVKEEQQE